MTTRSHADDLSALRALVEELTAALEQAEASQSYWAKMGVNIDCPPWKALTVTRAALAKAKQA